MPVARQSLTLFFLPSFSQRLIFVPHSDDEDEDNQGDDSSASSSSSDANHSFAAAHAAAIGHSPQPIRPTIEVPPNAPVAPKKAKTAEEDKKDAEGQADQEKSTPAKPGEGEAAEVAEETKESGGSPMDASPTVEGAKKDEKESTPTKEGSKASNGGKNSNEEKKKQKFYCPHNLNERDGDENTPIHVAIHCRKLEHVKLLLEAGANVHKKSDGSAPIHTAISIAALRQHEVFGYDCLVLLEKYDADLSAKDDAMHTPLYLACKFNLPNIATFLLSKEAGMSTLNTKADRSGGRPLHAAARFDTLVKGARVAGPSSQARAVSHHHPDGTVVNSVNHMPGYSGGKQSAQARAGQAAQGNAEATLTQLLLSTEGIEVDPLNSVGHTPLHIACMRANWVVARLLLQAGADQNIADRRGFTPGQLAHKRGMPIPMDLIDVLGGPPSSGTVAPPRDLIVDPDGTTMVLAHELCTLHRSCAPIRRDSNQEPPPENVRRLQVLLDSETGILRTGEFGRTVWEGEARRAAMVDVLKVRPYLIDDSEQLIDSHIVGRFLLFSVTNTATWRASASYVLPYQTTRTELRIWTLIQPCPGGVLKRHFELLAPSVKP